MEDHNRLLPLTNVPDWDEYFLGICLIIAMRSKDAQSKFGCVLVDKYNHIVGTGYNSFVRNMPDSELPNTRPEKYDKMLHAEDNALCNLMVNPWQSDVRAYVTGKPCLQCIQRLANSNIKKIIYLEYVAKMTLNEDQDYYNAVIKHNNLELTEKKSDFSWIIKGLENE